MVLKFLFLPELVNFYINKYPSLLRPLFLIQSSLWRSLRYKVILLQDPIHVKKTFIKRFFTKKNPPADSPGDRVG
jgi:hypothetical protein